MDAPENVDTLPQRLGAVIKAHPHYQRLATLGPPPQDPEPACWRCRDKGHLRHDVEVGHPEFGKLVRCVCQQQSVMAKRLARFWEKSQAPAEYAACTLESYPGDPTAVPTLRAWLAGERWLLLCGPVGAGKTGLTVALLRELAEQGRSVLFVNAPDMLRRVRATYSAHDDAASESAVVDSLAEVEVLAIDDIGKERLTPWAIELLYVVVNRRYNDGRRTLVTTNLAVDRLEAHLGSATFDRLYEKSQLVHIEGNLRRRSAS